MESATGRPSPRPSVTVIVPFAGASTELAELIPTLGALGLRNGDEVIVADNRPGLAADADHGRVVVRAAVGICSPGFARNRAAAMASGEWLVLIDADTVPDPELLDAYFEPPPGARTALLAGAIADQSDGDGFAARHSAQRGQMSQEVTLGRGPWAYPQSANCAVRRSAFVTAGGFAEDARAGEDADLCFRLRQIGWELETRPGARVRHRTRAELAGLLGQLVRHGSGAAWCERRHPGSFPPPGAPRFAARLARDAARSLRAAAHRDRDETRGALLDLAGACAFELGRLVPNRARRAG